MMSFVNIFEYKCS